MSNFWKEFLYRLAYLVPTGKQRYDAALSITSRKFSFACIARGEKAEIIQKEIIQMKDWAKSLNPLDRRAYMGWLNYFEGRLNDSLVEERKERQRQDYLNSGEFPIPNGSGKLGRKRR